MCRKIKGREGPVPTQEILGLILTMSIMRFGLPALLMLCFVRLGQMFEAHNRTT